MRVQVVRRKRFGGFGAISPTGANCPAGGSWDAWCDCMYPALTSPDLNTKCKRRPFPGGWTAPWTDVGSAARGLPKEGILAAAANVVMNVIPGSGSAAPTPTQVVTTPVVLPPTEEAPAIGGIPMAIVGVGAVAVLGGALLLRRRGRGRGRR